MCKPPSVRRSNGLGRRAHLARIAACHAHATPTGKRPASSGNLNNTTKAPPPSAANVGSPIKNSHVQDTRQKVGKLLGKGIGESGRGSELQTVLIPMKGFGGEAGELCYISRVVDRALCSGMRNGSLSRGSCGCRRIPRTDETGAGSQGRAGGVGKKSGPATDECGGSAGGDGKRGGTWGDPRYLDAFEIKPAMKSR